MIWPKLIPNARAWRTAPAKTLWEFMSAFGVLETGVKSFFDLVYLDLLPATTRQLDLWDTIFNLPKPAGTDADRRDRLAAAWSAVGGQAPKYIQDTLQAAGFDVYVHEWWVPGTEPPVGIKAAATARDPNTYLRVGGAALFLSGPNCGEVLVQCGELAAECGNAVGADKGYPLVNNVVDPGTVLPTLGSGLFPFFLYIGGEIFGTLATVDPLRRDEFEALCLKICPAHLWLGVLVEY